MISKAQAQKILDRYDRYLDGESFTLDPNETAGLARCIIELHQRGEKLHRRAQQAEGKSLRSIALLDLIIAKIKSVIPVLPTLPSPYPLSLHTLYHHLHAVRKHAKNSSGAAASVQFSYYRQFWERDQKRAEKAEAKVKELLAWANEAINFVPPTYSESVTLRDRLKEISKEVK